MKVIQGQCCTCQKPLVFLKWREDRLVIVVFCEECQDEVNFDFKRMLDSLTADPNEPDYEQMLRDFVPKGRPS